MREIKFRAWHPILNKMIRRPEIRVIHHANETFGCDGLDKNSSSIYLPLMQYTGLKDKNGVEIYEGDILDFDEVEWGGKFDPEAVPVIDKLIGDWGMHGSHADVSEWRAVIGNIYENPELLVQK